MMPVVTVSRVPMMISAPSIPGPRPRRSGDTGTGTPHRIEITERRGPRAGACAAATGESESKKLVLVFPSSPRQPQLQSDIVCWLCTSVIQF